jgi:heme/copper-type cytochrome/quinol oxidase subunit 2
LYQKADFFKEKDEIIMVTMVIVVFRVLMVIAIILFMFLKYKRNLNKKLERKTLKTKKIELKCGALNIAE